MVTGIYREEKKKMGAETVFENTVLENFLKLT